jgi:hypothetical protein
LILLLVNKSRPTVGSFFGRCLGLLLLMAGPCAAQGLAATVRDASDGEGASWQVSMQSSQYSDVLPLRYFGQRDWAQHVQPHRGRNLVQVEQSLVLTRAAKDSNQQWSLVARQMGRVVLDEPSARRIAQMGSGVDASQDWQWMPQIAYKAFSGYGLDWQYLALADEGFYAEGGAQALVLSRLSGRALGGEVDYSAVDGRYGFAVQSVQNSSQLRFPFQKPFDAQGQAWLLQGRWGWRSGALHVHAGVRDVGLLQWRGLPQQVLNLNSSTRTRDADGYILYRPLVQGQNSQTDVRWHAPWRGDVQLAWRASTTQTWSMPWQYVPGFGWLPALRWQEDGAGLKWALTWRQHQRDVLGQWSWGAWGFSLALGHTSASQQWGISYAFVH